MASCLKGGSQGPKPPQVQGLRPPWLTTWQEESLRQAHHRSMLSIWIEE